MRKQQEEFKSKSEINDAIWDMFNLPFSQAAMTWAYLRQIHCFIFSLTGRNKAASFFVLPFILSAVAPIMSVIGGPLSMFPGIMLMPSIPPFSLLIKFLPHKNPVTGKEESGILGTFIKVCSDVLDWILPFRMYLAKTADASIYAAKAGNGSGLGEGGAFGAMQSQTMGGAIATCCMMMFNIVMAISWISLCVALFFGGLMPVFAAFIGLAITFTVTFLVAPTTFIQSITTPFLYLFTVVILPFMATNSLKRIATSIVSKWKYLIPIWLLIAVYTAYDTYRTLGKTDTGTYVTIGMLIGIVYMYIMGIYYDKKEV